MASWNRMPEQLRGEIVDLASNGMRPALIFRKFNREVSLNSIYMVLARARKDGVAISRFPPIPLPRAERSGAAVVRVTVWREGELAALTRAAKARGVSVTRIVNRIVEVVLDGDLVDAVLDDRGADGN